MSTEGFVYEPRPHQALAADALDKHRSSGHPESLMTMFCGSGKTLVAGDHIRRHEGNALWISDRYETIWDDFTQLEKLFGEGNVGFFAGNRRETDKPVTVALFQTLFTEQGFEYLHNTHFKTAVANEGHHLVAPTFNQVWNLVRADHKIAMTATPDRADGQRLEERFGRPAFSLSLSEGYEQRLIPPLRYEVVGPGIVLDLINGVSATPENIEEVTQKYFRELNPAQMASYLNGTWAQTEHDRALIYTSRVRHAEEVARRIRGAVPYIGKVPWKKRLEVRTQYSANEIPVLVCCQLNLEGANLNAWFTVNASGTLSPLRLTHMMGRTLRWPEGQFGNFDIPPGVFTDIALSAQQVRVSTSVARQMGDDVDVQVDPELKPSRISRFTLVMSDEVRQIDDVVKEIEFRGKPRRNEIVFWVDHIMNDLKQGVRRGAVEQAMREKGYSEKQIIQVFGSMNAFFREIQIRALDHILETGQPLPLDVSDAIEALRECRSAFTSDVYDDLESVVLELARPRGRVSMHTKSEANPKKWSWVRDFVEMGAASEAHRQLTALVQHLDHRGVDENVELDPAGSVELDKTKTPLSQRELPKPLIHATNQLPARWARGGFARNGHGVALRELERFREVLETRAPIPDGWKDDEPPFDREAAEANVQTVGVDVDPQLLENQAGRVARVLYPKRRQPEEGSFDPELVENALELHNMVFHYGSADEDSIFQRTLKQLEKLTPLGVSTSRREIRRTIHSVEGDVIRAIVVGTSELIYAIRRDGEISSYGERFWPTPEHEAAAFDAVNGWELIGPTLPVTSGWGVYEHAIRLDDEGQGPQTQSLPGVFDDPPNLSPNDERDLEVWLQAKANWPIYDQDEKGTVQYPEVMQDKRTVTARQLWDAKRVGLAFATAKLETDDWQVFREHVALCMVSGLFNSRPRPIIQTIAGDIEWGGLDAARRAVQEISTHNLAEYLVPAIDRMLMSEDFGRRLLGARIAVTAETYPDDARERAHAVLDELYEIPSDGRGARGFVLDVCATKLALPRHLDKLTPLLKLEQPIAEAVATVILRAHCQSLLSEEDQALLIKIATVSFESLGSETPREIHVLAQDAFHGADKRSIIVRVLSDSRADPNTYVAAAEILREDPVLHDRLGFRAIISRYIGPEGRERESFRYVHKNLWSSFDQPSTTRLSSKDSSTVLQALQEIVDTDGYPEQLDQVQEVLSYWIRRDEPYTSKFLELAARFRMVGELHTEIEAATQSEWHEVRNAAHITLIGYYYELGCLDHIKPLVDQRPAPSEVWPLLEEQRVIEDAQRRAFSAIHYDGNQIKSPEPALPHLRERLNISPLNGPSDLSFMVSRALEAPKAITSGSEENENKSAQISTSSSAPPPAFSDLQRSFFMRGDYQRAHLAQEVGRVIHDCIVDPLSPLSRRLTYELGEVGLLPLFGKAAADQITDLLTGNPSDSLGEQSVVPSDGHLVDLYLFRILPALDRVQEFKANLKYWAQKAEHLKGADQTTLRTIALAAKLLIVSNGMDNEDVALGMFAFFTLHASNNIEHKDVAIATILGDPRLHGTFFVTMQELIKDGNWQAAVALVESGNFFLLNEQTKRRVSDFVSKGPKAGTHGDIEKDMCARLFIAEQQFPDRLGALIKQAREECRGEGYRAAVGYAAKYSSELGITSESLYREIDELRGELGSDIWKTLSHAGVLSFVDNDVKVILGKRNLIQKLAILEALNANDVTDDNQSSIVAAIRDVLECGVPQHFVPVTNTALRLGLVPEIEDLLWMEMTSGDSLSHQKFVAAKTLALHIRDIDDQFRELEARTTPGTLQQSPMNPKGLRELEP